MSPAGLLIVAWADVILRRFGVLGNEIWATLALVHSWNLCIFAVMLYGRLDFQCLAQGHNGTRDAEKQSANPRQHF